jgi:TP901 family phage tail tape measure protein
MADNATRLKILASVEGIQGFDGLKRSLQGLAQQSAATHQDLFKLNAAYEKLRRGSDGSINSMRLQVQALTQLRESVGTGTVMFGRYTAQLDEVRAKLDAVTRAERNVSNQQQRGGGIMASLATGAGVRGALTMQAGEAAMAGRLALAGGITAGLAAGAGAAAVVGGSISTAMDLAAEQRKVSTLTGDTAKLNQSIADLTRAQGYMTSQAEATSAAYEILSSGFSKTSDIIQILKASTLGAVGGFSDIRTVADATTSILNGYGRSAADAQKVVDMMIQTQNDGKIVVAEYATSIGRLVPTAAAANISLEEINAAVSALTAQGVPVESTFSGINQAIKSIIKPTDEARRMAAALGLDFSASALAAKGFGGFLADVTSKTKGNSAALSILFSDIDGYKAVVGLANDDLQRFNQFSRNQERVLNASAKAAEKAVDPFKQFSNANKDLGNSLGQVLLPPLTSVTKKVTELVRVIMGQGVPDRIKELLSLSSGLAMPIAPSAFGSPGAAFAIGTAIGKAGSALMDEFAPPPPPPPDGRRDLPTPSKLGRILPPQKTEDPKITELAGQVLEGGSNKPTAESLILKKPYGAQIIAAARKRGLDPALFAGLISTESAFSQSALSSAGAIGLGQLMPGTARELGVNPRDALQNLAGAAEYLAKQIATFGLEGGLRAYNQGPGNQQRFPGGVSAEARLYPGKVLAAAKGFGYEDAGGIKAAELQVSALDQRKRDAQKLAEQQQQQMERTAEQNQKINDQMAEREITEASSLNTAQQQLAAMQNMTEVMRARLEFAYQLQQIESDLAAKKADPMMSEGALKSAEAFAEVKKEEAKLTLADAERKSYYDQLSTQWQDQQVTLAATLSDYYSQQSEKLQEQNELAGSLAQTIGQGMQQAFSLAIQGAENLGQSLQELGATVLKDIAQQLIQIAVIAPVIRAISGIGGGGGIAPISPGINALPAGDFSQFFAPAAGSFTAGLPTAGITPFQGGNPFSFATGGIMTPQGPVPLRTYARGGIATAPQAAIYGEGSTPEAFIPLPDGRRVPVALKQYPGIPGTSSAAQFESTDQVVQRLVETARQESTARAAAVAASSPDGTVRIKVETTRINSVDYVTAEQAEALAQAAATRSTARQQRALQSSPGARRSLGI